MGTFVAGRVAERRALAAAVSQLAGGHGGVVALIGEGGLGKSHLLSFASELARELHLRVAWGAGSSAPGTPDGWPWIQVLRALGLDSGAPPSARDASAADRFGWVDATVRRLADAAALAPLLVVLDDLQGGDATSCNALSLLTVETRRTPLLILAGWRPGPSMARDEATRGATRFSLAPLEPDALAALAAHEGFPTDGRALAARTGGNPFFALEVLRAQGTGAPLSARALLVDRIETAAAPAAELAQRIALAGRLPDAVVRGWDAGPAALAAAAAGLITGDGDCWRPTHDLLAEVLIERLAPAARRAHHAALARALDGVPGWASAAAEHGLLAGDLVDRAVAIARGRAAAAAAAAALGWDEASRLLEAVSAAQRAVGAPAAERSATLIELATARLLAGDRRGYPACQEALACARDARQPQLVVRAAVTWGLASREGRVDAAHVALLREALAAVPPEAPVWVARVKARLAGAMQPALDPTEALRLVDEAVAGAREHGSPRDLLEVLDDARRALRVVEPLSQRVAMDREALALAESLGDEHRRQRALRRLLFDSWESGDGAGAELVFAQLSDAMALAQGERARRELAMLVACRATLRGDVAAGRAAWELASRCRVFDPEGPEWNLALQGAWLAEAWEAPSVTESLLAFTWPAPMDGPMRALLELHADSPPEARRTLAQLTHQLSGTKAAPYPLLWLTARVAIRLDDAEAARAVYPLLLPFRGAAAVWPGWCVVDGSVDRVLGELSAVAGEPARAAEHLRQGLTFDRRLGAALAIARGEAALARLTPARVAPPRSADARLTWDGQLWTVAATGRSVQLPDSDGLRYLAALVQRPGVDIPALDLVGHSRAAKAHREADALGDRGDAGELADPRALGAWRARLVALRDRWEEAEDLGNHELAESIHEEMLAVARAVSEATGLGGRARRARSPAEKARVNVTQRIRSALDRLSAADAVLGHALGACIRTGTCCRYDPAP